MMNVNLPQSSLLNTVKYNKVNECDQNSERINSCK